MVKDVLFSFTKLGLIGFGGGPAMVPLIHDEIVKRRGWMEDQEFGDVLAIANTLPGPIATKLPGYIGYKVAGALGSIVAILATITPMIFAMTALLGAYAKYQNVAWINGMGKSIIPVVMVMMLQLTWDFWKKSHSSLGLHISLGMVFFSGIIIYWIGIPPAIIIILLLTGALIIPVSSLKPR